MIDITKQYGVVINIRIVIEKYWENKRSVVKKGRYFGDIFDTGRGVTQGDIISPILFNVLIYCVVRKLESNIDENWYIKLESFPLFYEYGGVIIGICSSNIQKITTDLVEVFEIFGCFTNKTKTKIMITTPPD